MSRVLPTEIKFYRPVQSTGGVDISQPELTKIAAQLFPPISNIEANVKNVVYRKIVIFNHNPDNELIEPVIEIVENPNTFFSIALEQKGAQLPIDGDDINVTGGYGPGQFTVAPISFGNIKSNDYVSLWIRRFIFWPVKETLNINFKLKLVGNSDE